MIIWRPFMCQMYKIVEKCLILETRTCMFDNEWQEPRNRFAPNSYGRRVWSFAGMSLNVKVKGHGHQGQKRTVHSQHPHGVNRMERHHYR